MDREVAWLGCSGELDIVTSPRLERALQLAVLRAQLTVLDLRDVSFIDLTGVHVIERVTARARGIGRRLLIVVPGPAPVARILIMGKGVELLGVTSRDLVDTSHPLRRRTPGRPTAA